MMIISTFRWSIFATIFFIVESVSNVSVKIKVHPKTLKAGDELTVECLIYNITASDRFKTFFNCPFFGKETEYCYADCVSLCQHISCTGKNKFINSFKCSWDSENNLRKFTFNIPSISTEQINNRKMLPFSCKFMNLESRDNVTVLETTESNSKPNVESSSITTDPTKVNVKQSSMTNYITSHKDYFHIGLWDIILIVLISSLIVSFLINVWCCVHWCMRKTKNKKRKREEYRAINEELSRESNTGSIIAFNPQCVDKIPYPPTNHFTDGQISRARSQPILLNNHKNNPIKVSNSNLSKRINSVTNTSKYRTPIHNNSINEIYHNGSIPEHINPYQGQQFVAYLSPQYIPMTNYPFVQNQYDHMNSSQSEDLNTLLDEQTTERIMSSTMQPLPSKPDECFSNLESASSSHIV